MFPSFVDLWCNINQCISNFFFAFTTLSGGTAPEKVVKSIPSFLVSQRPAPATTFTSLLIYSSEIFETCTIMNVYVITPYFYTAGTILTTVFSNLPFLLNNVLVIITNLDTKVSLFLKDGLLPLLCICMYM